jgi:hypothetical protein
VDLYLEAQFTNLYPQYVNNFVVARQSQDLGYSWIVTFKGEMFYDNVEELVVVSSVNLLGMLASTFRPFTVNKITTVLATTTVTSLASANDLPAGQNVFVRVVAINAVGVGPAKVATVGTNGTSMGSIVPRSPPGLPLDVTVYAVPASVGDQLLVTWSQGQTYGSAITHYTVEYCVNAAQSSSDVYSLGATVLASNYTGNYDYSTFISVTPFQDYTVRVKAYNGLGAAPPSWFLKVGAHDTTSITEALDYQQGAQRAQSQCIIGLDECSEAAAFPAAFVVLARGLPRSSSLSVPSYPTVDTAQSFTATSGFITFAVPSVNGNGVDKWRVEWWDTISPQNVFNAVVNTTYYNITSLTMGHTYYIRVIAHSTAGYGESSSTYAFTPRQQPDAPFAPAVGVASYAPNMTAYATSLNVSWQHPQISSPDLVGGGGSPVLQYLVEWSKLPFSAMTPTVIVIDLHCVGYSASFTQGFQLSLSTATDASKSHPSDYFTTGQLPGAGTYVSANIPATATAYDMQVILENMPNVAQVTVTKTSSINGPVWYVTFNEATEVPLFTVVDTTCTCHGSVLNPIISYSGAFSYSSSALYSWMNVTVDGSVTDGSTYFVIENLLPGETYYTRVSASNDLGFGPRRLTAPASFTVPVTQPTVPTQYEGDWGMPRLFRATPTSLLVKVGPSDFNGGSFISYFNVQWDTSSDFDSSPSGSPLGSVPVAAFSTICTKCVESITFSYSSGTPVVTISYVGTSDTVRLLQTGVRVGIITSDDNVPYTFRVADSSATTTSFVVENAGTRALIFNSTGLTAPDLFLLGAQFEISDLSADMTYFVRVNAENTAGVCDDSAMFAIEECGGFTATSPGSLNPHQSPSEPSGVSASATGVQSVAVSWLPAESVAPIVSYRVDAFTRSSQASVNQSSFFGDAEVQQLQTTSLCTNGTFTLAYDSFGIALPGAVSGFYNLKKFNTTDDISSHLEPGDQIMVDGVIYTIAAYEYFDETGFTVLERIKGTGLNGDVVASKVWVRPKTLPIPYNIDAAKLTELIENQPYFGQVKIERTRVNGGHVWHITFMTNVGPQPLLIVNPLHLLGSDPTVAVTRLDFGTMPDNYVSATVFPRSGMMSTSFTGLATGLTWYFRVLATNDISDGPLSSFVSAVPADVPLAVSSVELDPYTGSSLLVTYTMDADPQGSAITGYNVSVSSAGSSPHWTFYPNSYQHQQIIVDAHTAPFTSTSQFTLSVANYSCCFNTYASMNSSTTNRVDAVHARTNLQMSLNNGGWQSLANYVGLGEFVHVGHQDFRVCLNQDAKFVALNGILNDSVVPLCDMDTAMIAKPFDAGFSGHRMEFLPLYRLDTSVGSAAQPVMGSSVLSVNLFDASVNDRLGLLSYGDWLMLGHPVRGEEFRVNSVTANTITIGTVADPSVIASMSIASLQHASYMVQILSLNSTSSFTNSTLATGFRLRFKDSITYVTVAGGGLGCLSLHSSAQAVSTELEYLLSIDDVVVSKTTTTDSVAFAVTFVGDLVRGQVPLIDIIDVGSNGCNSEGINVRSYVWQSRDSFMPVYRLQTTAPLDYDATASDVQDALEALSYVARADVTRSVYNNGYSWSVSFRSFSDWNSVNMPLLYMNSVNIAAAVKGVGYTYPIGRQVLSNLLQGTTYFVAVAPVNSYGNGPSKASMPMSKQPFDQVPGSPANLRVTAGAGSTVFIQFDKPVYTGGPDVSSYRVQWDTQSNFKSSNGGMSPLGELVIRSDDTASSRPEVQVVSLVSQIGFNPAGTFVLSNLSGSTSLTLDTTYS